MTDSSTAVILEKIEGLKREIQLRDKNSTERHEQINKLFKEVFVAINDLQKWKNRLMGAVGILTALLGILKIS